MDEHTRTLIVRAKARDRAAVEELFGRYRERLRSALRKLVGGRCRIDVGDSEDAVQDAILKAFTRIDRFEYRGDGSFLAWLLKCAENEILQRLRAMSTLKRSAQRLRRIDEESLLEPVDGGATPSQVAGGHEFEERIRTRLEMLPEREREVIMLRRYLALDMEEIRDELGLPSAGAVRALLSRAQTRLARLLEDGAET